MDWQPIETAPKDKPIQVIGGHYVTEGQGRRGCPKDPLVLPLTVKFSNSSGYEGCEWEHAIRHYYSIGVRKPTHWMPVPAPPDRTWSGGSVAPPPVNTKGP